MRPAADAGADREDVIVDGSQDKVAASGTSGVRHVVGDPAELDRPGRWHIREFADRVETVADNVEHLPVRRHEPAGIIERERAPVNAVKPDTSMCPKLFGPARVAVSVVSLGARNKLPAIWRSSSPC